jgi:hypothetical protein
MQIVLGPVERVSETADTYRCRLLRGADGVMFAAVYGPTFEDALDRASLLVAAWETVVLDPEGNAAAFLLAEALRASR